MDSAVATAHFSFFVTSYKAIQDLSGSASGFGGDLRFGETGLGSGLRGADKICATIAEKSMPGAGQKKWRAFLSAASDENGKQVDAIDRIGDGPWFDRLGRTFAMKKADLLQERPSSADPAIQNDFPNENGDPNHRPDTTQPEVDNHDMLTGTSVTGRLYAANATCLDWTSNKGDRQTEGLPRVGHSWPRTDAVGGLPDGGVTGIADGDGGFLGFPDGGFPDGGFPGMPDGGFPDGGFPGIPDGATIPSDGGSGDFSTINNWMSSLDESGCAPGVNLLETGGPLATANTVGSGGGYGGFYCFSLTP